MQVANVGLYQNNYSQKSNPNFTSIKSIKCEGLYKKYPDLANDLVDAFRNNPKAMDFCKKYDVDIVFYAVKQMHDSVESSVHIFFDNISKSKFRKFFEKLVGGSDDNVTLHAWGNKYSLAHSLEDSTADLVDAISPERKVLDGYRGGLLDSHLASAEERMEKILAQKAKKQMAVESKIAEAKNAKSKLESDTSKLQDSINDLIDNGQ